MRESSTVNRKDREYVGDVVEVEEVKCNEAERKVFRK
jgi:hypothetical protein